MSQIILFEVLQLPDLVHNFDNVTILTHSSTCFSEGKDRVPQKRCFSRKLEATTQHRSQKLKVQAKT